MVVEAIGDNHVRGRADRARRGWPPAIDRSDVIADVDALMIGWGFRPNVEVTALLRCGHAYDRPLAAGFASPIPNRATSVAQVYAAGEVTGMAGAWPARAAGRSRASSAAVAAGFAPSWLEGERRAAFAGITSRPRVRRWTEPALRAARAPAEAMRPGHDCVPLRRGHAARHHCSHRIRGRAACKGSSAGAAPDGPLPGPHLRLGRGRNRGDAGMPAEQAGFNAPRIPLRPVPLTTVLNATRGLEADAPAAP